MVRPEKRLQTAYKPPDIPLVLVHAPHYAGSRLPYMFQNMGIAALRLSSAWVVAEMVPYGCSAVVVDLEGVTPNDRADTAAVVIGLTAMLRERHPTLKLAVVGRPDSLTDGLSSHLSALDIPVIPAYQERTGELSQFLN